MYFQRDYILRMIEMIGELARRLLAMADEADARAELDEISRRACGMPLVNLKKTDVQTLETLLSEPQRFLTAQLLLIACEVDARTHGEDELIPTRAQALGLLATLEDPDFLPQACNVAHRTMEPLLDALSAQELRSAAALFERGDFFAAAEDALYAAEDDEARLAFYRRALLQEDRLLRAGGLPREEIIEAIGFLERKTK